MARVRIRVRAKAIGLGLAGDITPSITLPEMQHKPGPSGVVGGGGPVGGEPGDGGGRSGDWTPQVHLVIGLGL